MAVVTGKGCKSSPWSQWCYQVLFRAPARASVGAPGRASACQTGAPFAKERAGQEVAFLRAQLGPFSPQAYLGKRRPCLAGSRPVGWGARVALVAHRLKRRQHEAGPRWYNSGMQYSGLCDGGSGLVGD